MSGELFIVRSSTSTTLLYLFHNSIVLFSLAKNVIRHLTLFEGFTWIPCIPTLYRPSFGVCLDRPAVPNII